MDEPMIGPLYKPNDERVETDLPPLVYDTWSSTVAPDSGSEEDTDLEEQSEEEEDESEDGMQLWLSTIELVGVLLNERPVAANARNMKRTVLDIQFESGKSVFVRALQDADQAGETVQAWKLAKLSAELEILRWLEANASNLPVPRVLGFDDVNSLLVTTVMPGMDVFHSYPYLSPAAKEASVVSWARVAVSMFRIATPQRFGMVESPLYLDRSPGQTFTTENATDILSSFQGAISARRAHSFTVNNAEAHGTLCSNLDRLLEGLKPFIAQAQDNPTMSRFVLNHTDLHMYNIMLDQTSGEVVGIVDWEYYACMPACMSTGYPSWINASTLSDADDPDPKFLSFFFEPRAECNRLRELYKKVVQELDEDYYHCLLHGATLRNALSWIEDSDEDDPDGDDMAEWVEETLFSSVSVKL
ncbi:hypothetical protein DFH06DRAFT_1331780 [Mycena polygramma]|nr:hypothetical protein DFH06DRAFT_1331780 [Mycena polygramma]